MAGWNMTWRQTLRWLANFEYRDRYLGKPERLWDDAGNVRGLEEYLVATIPRGRQRHDR